MTYSQDEEVVAFDFLERDPFPGQQPGREGLKAIILMTRAAFPDLEWLVDEMVAEGEIIASRFTWRGTHGGAFLGIPATGKQITVTGMVFDRVVAGQPVESASVISEKHKQFRSLDALDDCLLKR